MRKPVSLLTWNRSLRFWFPMFPVPRIALKFSLFPGNLGNCSSVTRKWTHVCPLFRFKTWEVLNTRCTYLNICSSAFVNGSFGVIETNFENDQSRQEMCLLLGFPQYHDIPPLSRVRLQASEYCVSQRRSAWHVTSSLCEPFMKTAPISLVPWIWWRKKKQKKTKKTNKQKTKDKYTCAKC